jgi:tetratricopeptide (TPR) repeat protein
MNLKILLYIIFAFQFFNVFPQSEEDDYFKIDSIKNVILSTNNDSIKIDFLFQLDDLVYMSNSEWDRKINKEIVSICLKKRNKSKKHFIEQYAFALNNLSLNAIEKSEMQLALEYLLKAYKISKAQKLKKLKDLESNVLNNIGLVYRNIGSNRKALEYYLRSAAIINDSLKDANTFNNIGLCYSDMDDEVNAFKYFNKSLRISRITKNEINEANVLCNIADIQFRKGDFYGNQGNYIKALEFHFKNLKLKEELKDFKGIALCYSNIGVVYDHQADYSNALSYYKKGLDYEKLSNNNAGIAKAYNNLAFIYKVKKDYSKSFFYLKKALELNRKIEALDGISETLDNFGSYYLDLKKPASALPYFEESLSLDIQANNLSGMATNYHNMGNAYYQLNNIREAKNNALKSLEMAQIIAYPKIIESSSKLLSDIYQEEKNWEKAFAMNQLYQKMKDSLNNIQNKKESHKIGIKYDFDKQKSLAKKENEKKLAIANEREQQQKIIILFGVIGFLIVSIFSFLNYKRYKLTQKQKSIIEKQKHLVEEKNQEITDSITYAKRIQSAILPQPKLVKKFLEDSFILYKPKDIVAGDFYWLEVVGDTVLFAAADCTGHGVPGAMVSVVCNNGLNRAVREFGLTNPSEILDKTRELVIEEFEKSDEDVKDGMDISLCALNVKTKQLRWSGANNPLWILRDQEILEFKGDKQPIGKHFDAKPFTQKEI